MKRMKKGSWIEEVEFPPLLYTKEKHDATIISRTLLLCYAIPVPFRCSEEAKPQNITQSSSSVPPFHYSIPLSHQDRAAAVA